MSRKIRHRPSVACLAMFPNPRSRWEKSETSDDDGFEMHACRGGARLHVPKGVSVRAHQAASTRFEVDTLSVAVFPQPSTSRTSGILEYTVIRVSQCALFLINSHRPHRLQGRLTRSRIRPFPGIHAQNRPEASSGCHLNVSPCRASQVQYAGNKRTI